MLMMRPVMATTTLEGLMARACGLPGRDTRMVELDGSLVLCRFRLQSHEAETRMPCLGLYRTERAGAVCLLRRVFSPDLRLILCCLLAKA